MPVDLLLGQLSQNTTDESVKDVLRTAFVNVDRDYFESVINEITSRMVLKMDPNIPPDDPKLKRLDAVLNVGASATIAVILGARLFVANAGDSCAVLCTAEPSGELRTTKLSIDHVLGNEDEELRLTQLGIQDLNEDTLPSPHYTRCLGVHGVKGAFRDNPRLASASDDPVLSEPEMTGGIPIGPEFQFLLIFSRSLTDCLAQVSSVDPAVGNGNEGGDVVGELCRITAEQFAENTTVSGVAQSVVDKIVRMHREQFEMRSGSLSACTEREDMTLLVRKFSAKLGRRKKSSAGSSAFSESPLLMEREAETIARRPEETIVSKEARARPTTRSSTTTESSDVFVKNVRELPVDENGRIEPYVDFSHFNAAWAKHKLAQ